MPELPEVEFATEQLRRWVRSIDTVEVLEPRALRDQSPSDLAQALAGREVEQVSRRGKHILCTANGHLWWIHLGMTGRLARRKTLSEFPNGTRWAVQSAGQWVGLVDARIFGRTAAGDPSWVMRTAKLDRLGPDARTIDEETLHARLGRTRRAVKTALMDQSVIAGLGNIQAAEALFRAGIQPTAPSLSLDRAQVRALCAAVHGTLEDTLEDLRRSSGPEDSDVIDMSEGGSNPFQVYGREGQPCPRCEAPITRIVQGGRSTFLCGQCQPECFA